LRIDQGRVADLDYREPKFFRGDLLCAAALRRRNAPRAVAAIIVLQDVRHICAPFVIEHAAFRSSHEDVCQNDPQMSRRFSGHFFGTFSKLLMSCQKIATEWPKMTRGTI